MIGENLIADIAGGHVAGLRTNWINQGSRPDHEHNADHVVTHVLEAMDILHDEA